MGFWGFGETSASKIASAFATTGFPAGVRGAGVDGPACGVGAGVGSGVGSGVGAGACVCDSMKSGSSGVGVGCPGVGAGVGAGGH